MKEIIFTTTNKHKIKSAESVLNKYGINVIGQEVEVPEIQSNSPEEVIKDKVKKCYEIIQKPLIAMDSGLFIESLGGFPGVYTKYVLETIGEEGLMTLANTIPNCTAYVQRMIGYTDGKVLEVFSSKGHGEIISEKRGDDGYNYDYIFYVPEKKKTLAEMSHEERVKVWGDAWKKLGEFLKEL
ncbi:MAG: non-canonical purine NTP pyrophosphatase [Patescibacteria group bacterium]